MTRWWRATRARPATPNVADPATAKIIITIPHPNEGNHNGGPLKFGPDGYLYMATGDGGGGGDPGENAQDLAEVLGKQLRLDINTTAPYVIPPTNPFVGVPGARGEIWAYGLRNPWRFTFDRLTGDMFIGDVGQGAREEVDFQPAGVGGLNYGWDDMEGSLCYEPSSGCQTANRVLPIIQVDHSSGDCAIVGGYRYRGTAIPSLAGKYVHSDNCSGRIRIAHADGTGGTWTRRHSTRTRRSTSTPSARTRTASCTRSGGGTIYRLVSAVPVASIADRTQAGERRAGDVHGQLSPGGHAAGDGAVLDGARAPRPPASTTRRPPAPSRSRPARPRARCRSRSSTTRSTRTTRRSW